MNKLSWGLHAISIVAIAYLIWDKCQNSETTTPEKTEFTTSSDMKFAYVDSDSLTNNYAFLSDKGEDFAKKEFELQQQLNTKVAALEKRFATLQSKADIMTRAELESAQAELQQMEAEITNLRSSLAQQLDQERYDMQMQLYDRVDGVLKNMAKTNNLDAIFSYTKGGQVLYINNSLELTDQVLGELNRQYELEKGSK